jgi:hypothetical protein
MSKQTTEEMAQAERRAQVANKDKALAVEREALLRSAPLSTRLSR